MPAPKWSVGMQRIGPGVYVDREGRFNLDEYELCKAAGVPYTEETAEMLRRAWLAEFGGTGRVVKEED